jgi:hypothetical protein
MGSVLHVGDDVERGGQRAGSATLWIAAQGAAQVLEIGGVLEGE